MGLLSLMQVIYGRSENMPTKQADSLLSVSFLKQMAVSYGLGLRLNFDYFILRFDAGMKAIDPAYSSGRRHYPIVHPKFSRDFTFHFAVGLPF